MQSGLSSLQRVAVILPALNEVESLPLVLADLPEVGYVIVVDNGSSDGTSEVAKRLGAIVAEEPQRGYGSACLRGLAALDELIADRSPAIGARASRPHCRLDELPSDRLSIIDVVTFLDADYSDHPEMLPQLVTPILDDDTDFVLGSRLAGVRQRGAMPVQSVLGNRLACFLMRRLFGARYTDLGPFRAIRLSSLRQLNMQDTDFGWTIEMQIKAIRCGLRIQEIPVPYRRRVGRSKISGTVWGTLRAGTKILYTIARYGLDRNQRAKKR